MIEITKENIDNANVLDKHWEKPKKKRFFKRNSGISKTIMYLTVAVIIFTIANLTLIYSFYKILMKL